MAKKKIIKKKPAPAKPIVVNKPVKPTKAPKPKQEAIKPPAPKVKPSAKPIKASKPTKQAAKASKPTKSSTKPKKAVSKPTKAPKPSKKSAKASKSTKKQPDTKPKAKKSAATKKPSKKKSAKKNRGSKEWHKIKKYLLARYRKRCNIESDKDATVTAKNVYKWLVSSKKIGKKQSVTHKLLKVALDELFPQEQRMFGRRRVPDIPQFSQQPTEFYNIEDVIRDIDRGLYRRVFIYSPLILGKRNNGYVFLNGSKRYTYEETFQGWVDWVNEQIKDGYYKEGSPPDIWYRFLDVFWNTRRKRWEVKIIPCDVDGDCLNTGYLPEEDCDTDETEDNYGINPNDLEKEKKAEEEAALLAKKAEEEAQSKSDEKNKSKEKEAEVKESPKVISEKLKTEKEQQKAWKIQTLIRAKQSIMEDIKFNREIGEKYDDLVIKLNAVRDQIDKLLEE
jgi:hypothetical protein